MIAAPPENVDRAPGVFCVSHRTFRKEEDVGGEIGSRKKTAPVQYGPELFAYILKLLDRVVDSKGEYHRR